MSAFMCASVTNYDVSGHDCFNCIRSLKRHEVTIIIGYVNAYSKFTFLIASLLSAKYFIFTLHPIPHR